MQSRIRKMRKSSENIEEVIEKQLNCDFQVHQYLNQNKLESHNIDIYVKMYNELLVGKNVKMNHLEALQVNKSKISEKMEENISDDVNSQNPNNQKYSQIQIDTSNEMEVKSNLQKEIVQTKKSLNLLKGDMGHLVSRNESSKLLSSKIAKVKIVANDQLKRVTMAFGKDKQEIKLRNQMQKKFSKKLKNVSSYEDTTLIKMKKHYVDSVQRKKEIFDNLNYIEKVSQSIEEYGDLEKQKNQKNAKILSKFEDLSKVKDIVLKFSFRLEEQNEEFSKDIKEMSKSIHEFDKTIRANSQFSTQKMLTNKSRFDVIREINSYELDIISEESLTSIQNIIFAEYELLKESIKKNTQIYNEGIKKKQELITIQEKLETEESLLIHSFIDDLHGGYTIQKTTVVSYVSQLKKFKEIIKTYYCLFEFFEKNIHYTSSKIKAHLKTVIKSVKSQHSESCDKIERKSNNSQHSTINEPESTFNYITQLHRIIKLLQKKYSEDFNQEDQLMEELINKTSCFLFEKIERNVLEWLNIIKRPIIDSKGYIEDTLIDKNRISKTKSLDHFRSSFLKSQTNGFHHKKQSNNICSDEEEQIKEEEKISEAMYKQHQIESKENIRPLVNYSRLKNIHPLKSSHPQKGDFIKAQRIQLLENIDQDYYKMLKSTIKMEKQNTRKNYLFTRTFKRAKYASRDDILQEKRFQASFSILFADRSKNLHSEENNYIKDKFMTSKFSKDQSKKSTLSKTMFNAAKNEFVTSKYSSNKLIKPKQPLKTDSHVCSIKNIKMKSNFEQEKEQKKLRLTQKLKEALSYV